MGGDGTPRAPLVVIGAGPGGYAAAFLGADLGLDVTLVDPEAHPGGVCLYRGCIPSKALLHAARLLGDAREAHDLGLEFGAPKIHRERLRGWKDGVVERLTGGLGQLARQRRVRHVRGLARFVDAHTLEVTAPDGGREGLAFEHAIVATGSRPAELGVLPADSPRVLDSTEALELRSIPRRLLVVGGGYIGLELGTVYAALGSEVTLVELTDSLLPGVDADLVRPLARRLEGSFASIRLGTRVVEARDTRRALRVSVSGPAGDETLDFDAALVAVGRVPNSDGLGLEALGLETAGDGTIPVDAARRTAVPHVFAIGDVAGQPFLAHKATHEGRVAAEAVAGGPAAFEPRAIPAVVFTDPEIAWCGITEREARASGRSVSVARFPWAASGRALTVGRPEGLTKLIVDPETERVLGLGVCGAGAGELVAEGVLALEMGATARDLAESIHPHPTLSETVMEAAEVFLGHPTHVHRPRGERRGGGSADGD